MPLTESQFKSQPLGGFIHDNRSNFEIATKIAEFFEDRDGYSYTAIVSDQYIPVACRFNEKKWRVHNTSAETIRGKYIVVYKNAKAKYKEYKYKSTVSALVKGLVKEHGGDLRKIADGLEEVCGGCWSVVKGYARVSTRYNQYHFSFKLEDHWWEVWRM